MSDIVNKGIESSSATTYGQAMDRHPMAAEIAELVHHYFDERQIAFSYDPEQGLGEAQGAEFSVHNLAANLARIDRDDWPDYVAWHFRHLADGPPSLPTDYSRARRKLRVRLASRDMVDQLPFPDIAKPVAEDLYQVLMIAIDNGASTVPPDSLEAWNTDRDTVWEDATKNTLLDEPRERRAMLKPSGERLTWVRGSWWSSTLLLGLGRYLSSRQPHGALAMVPVRDALLFHEITDDSFVYSMSALIETGLTFHFDGPDSISPHVYWWHDGSIRRLVAFEDGRLLPVWGDEFREVLADLEAPVPMTLN